MPSYLNALAFVPLEEFFCQNVQTCHHNEHATVIQALRQCVNRDSRSCQSLQDFKTRQSIKRKIEKAGAARKRQLER